MTGIRATLRPCLSNRIEQLNLTERAAEVLSTSLFVCHCLTLPGQWRFVTILSGHRGWDVCSEKLAMSLVSMIHTFLDSIAIGYIVIDETVRAPTRYSRLALCVCPRPTWIRSMPIHIPHGRVDKSDKPSIINQTYGTDLPHPVQKGLYIISRTNTVRHDSGIGDGILLEFSSRNNLWTFPFPEPITLRRRTQCHWSSHMINLRKNCDMCRRGLGRLPSVGADENERHSICVACYAMLSAVHDS